MGKNESKSKTITFLGSLDIQIWILGRRERVVKEIVLHQRIFATNQFKEINAHTRKIKHKTLLGRGHAT